jgi:hypothetical protein
MSDYLGKWYNELGSQMNITVAEDGFLKGRYESAVGDEDKEYEMVGRYDTKGRSLRWTVTWNNTAHGSSNSTTSWSGQYHPDEGNIILTTWLLTNGTCQNMDWSSTHVGTDTFHRKQPSYEVTQKALKIGGRSHPTLPTDSSGK